MRLEQIISRLCRDLVAEASFDDGQSVAITSLSYPNGDSVNLYFRDLGDEVEVSDEGTTLRFLWDHHVEVNHERRQMIKTMCAPYDVDLMARSLTKRFTSDEAGTACMQFCEAVTRVSSIYYHSAGAKRSSLPVAVDELLRKKVESTRHITRGWTSLRFDPKESYPVDFHLNGVGTPRNIFSVTSRGKAILVAAVIHFLKSHRLNFPSMTIIDTDAHLGPRDVNRLQLAATEIRYGLDKHHEDVVKFALATD